jgi:acetyltransferase-like isoleucine patch superfamily enzyme
MVNSLIRKTKRYFNLSRHRKTWRKMNAHNFTVASTFFPVDKVRAGNHSYGDLHIISQGEENEGLEIGHYVCIATGVTFLLGGNHYYKRFTNYPFVYKFQDINYVETWSKGKISIGDDVWIGTMAFIMSGVTIGRGAIVGACSVVTRDIPPYAIVTGNPARVVKYRFDEETVKKLMAIDFGNLKPNQVLKDISNYQKEGDFDSPPKF